MKRTQRIELRPPGAHGSDDPLRQRAELALVYDGVESYIVLDDGGYESLSVEFNKGDVASALIGAALVIARANAKRPQSERVTVCLKCQCELVVRFHDRPGSPQGNSLVCPNGCLVG